MPYVIRAIGPPRAEWEFTNLQAAKDFAKFAWEPEQNGFYLQTVPFWRDGCFTIKQFESLKEYIKWGVTAGYQPRKGGGMAGLRPEPPNKFALIEVQKTVKKL